MGRAKKQKTSAARAALWAVIDAAPEPYSALLRAYVLDPRNGNDDIRSFYEVRRHLKDLILEAAEVQASVTDYYVRANCPLCEPRSLHPYARYTVPEGLERHLDGSHRVRGCEVLQAAGDLARDRDVQRDAEAPEIGPPTPSTSAPRPVNGAPVADGEDTLWEIDTEGEIDSPYRAAVSVPSLRRLVFCNRDEAERVRERWGAALRWRVINPGTRMWVSSHLRPGYIPTLADPNETDLVLPKRDIQKWVWVAPEPVFVDERGSREQRCMAEMRAAIHLLGQRPTLSARPG